MDASSFIVNIIRKSVHVLVKRSQEDAELQIRDDDTTNSLCSAIEAIFLNGQEEPYHRKMLTKFGFGSTRHPYECCFWEYLQYYLPKQLIDMIVNSRIQEKRTPIGCCRVWVRVALNEATLCNFLEAMRCDEERMNRFYKPVALLRDADRIEAALGLLRMVTSECAFDLDFVGWELNSWNMSLALGLANVHYVAPTVTPLRRHTNAPSYNFSTDQRRPSDSIRPPSWSSPVPINEAEEPKEKSESASTPPVEVKERASSSPRQSSAVSTSGGEKKRASTSPRRSPPVSSVGAREEMTSLSKRLSPAESYDGLDEEEKTIENETQPLCEAAGDTLRNSQMTTSVPAVIGSLEQVSLSPSDNYRDSAVSGSITSSFTPSSASIPVPQSSSLGSRNDPPLSAIQVAAELSASPQNSPQTRHYPMISVASMSPGAIVAEAMRRGLLVASSLEMPLSPSYLETLINAVEDHRRLEREEALESILGRPHQSNRTGSPMASADETSLASSWDKNVGNSSSPSAQELGVHSESPLEMLEAEEEEGQLDDHDEFMVFPRRRTRDSSGDFNYLMASTSVPNLTRAVDNRATNISELEQIGQPDYREATSLSTSWDRPDQRTAAIKSQRRQDRSSSIAVPSAIRTPPSDGMLERLASNLYRGSRSGAMSFMSRIGSGLIHHAARFRGHTTAGKQESDDEWEIVGDEFIATKNARYTRLLDIHPGAERVPDPQHDFADTNCTRCRGHIIGRLRKLDHYDGRWYCTACHEGALCILPRRVIYHWDFSPQKVSNETKVILTRMFLQPNIDVMKMNPELYSICPELREVTRVRRQLAFLWQYVVDCSSGVGRDMNRILIPRERLIGTIPEIHLYSLEDLNLIYSGGALLKLVHHALKIGLTHVWSCSECQTSRPHFCERCGERIPLYQLDIYHKCLTATCDAVVHKRCFAHYPDDFLCLVCTRKRENKVPLHESYDAVFVD